MSKCPNISPESKADTVDEEDQYCQTEYTQKGIHSNLQVRQSSSGLGQLTIPSAWYLHLCWIATVVPCLAGASASAAAAAPTRSLTTWSTMGYCALGRCANLVKGNKCN